jgi:protocatechuate 3,4-dioxygenase beta subunit
MSKDLKTRRSVLTQTSAIALGLGAAAALRSRSQMASANSPIPPTPEQTSGPFYPVEDQLDKDADMTRIKGNTESAKGFEFQLVGQLLSASTGLPIAGALIEFWQACTSGRYNHPDDTNPAELDPNFQYWAQVQTGEQGEFSIRTIIPGAYPAAPDWTRPPHIHVRVEKVGYRSLTTQVYFEQMGGNSEDKILQALKPEDQDRVMLKSWYYRKTAPWIVALVPQSEMNGSLSLAPTPEIP